MSIPNVMYMRANNKIHKNKKNRKVCTSTMVSRTICTRVLKFSFKLKKNSNLVKAANRMVIYRKISMTGLCPV